jgi:hypothetical protein
MHVGFAVSTPMRLRPFPARSKKIARPMLNKIGRARAVRRPGSLGLRLIPPSVRSPCARLSENRGIDRKWVASHTTKVALVSRPSLAGRTGAREIAVRQDRFDERKRNQTKMGLGATTFGQPGPGRRLIRAFSALGDPRTEKDNLSPLPITGPKRREIATG